MTDSSPFELSPDQVEDLRLVVHRATLESDAAISGIMCEPPLGAPALTHHRKTSDRRTDIDWE